MCYGDPYYGKDGYYLNYLNQMEEEYCRKQEEIENRRADEESE